MPRHRTSQVRRRIGRAGTLAAPILAVAALVVSGSAGLAGHAARPDAHRLAFQPGSWWNTPIGSAPVDRHSAAYIKDSENIRHTQGYLKLVSGRWGSPTYTARRSDRAYTINPTRYGPTVTVHIPRHARPQRTSDGQLTVIDRSTDQSVGLWRARYHRGTRRWTASGADRYYLGSNGIQHTLPGGHRGNDGHRGIPAAYQAVHKKEVRAGAINHPLEIYWWATAGHTPEGPKAYFPMNGAEQHKGGVVPEGIVLRIKPWVKLTTKHLSRAALVVATALQRYGGIIGDNSGSGNNLKLQSNANWSHLLRRNSLRSIPWRDYEFVKGGHRR
jgi:hypothetical protein